MYVNQIFIEHLLWVPSVGDAEVNICFSNGTRPVVNRRMRRFGAFVFINKQTNIHTYILDMVKETEGGWGDISLSGQRRR